MEENLYERPRYPILVVISGASGVGKDTIAQLLQKRQYTFHFVVTATTRAPRPGEVHGKDYFFVTKDEFARLIEEDELLEWAIVYEDYKGIPKQQVREALASGKDVIMRLDPQGAATIRKLIPQAITIFLMAESEEAMVRRLRKRRTETPESLALRIATARQEVKRITEFDYVVVNAEGRQEPAVDQILCIIEAAHRSVRQKPIVL